MSLQKIEGLTAREQRKLQKFMLRELLQRQVTENKKMRKKQIQQRSPKPLKRDRTPRKIHKIETPVHQKQAGNSSTYKLQNDENVQEHQKNSFQGHQKHSQSPKSSSQQQIRTNLKQQQRDPVQCYSQNEQLNKNQKKQKVNKLNKTQFCRPLNKYHSLNSMQFSEYIMSYSYSKKCEIIDSQRQRLQQIKKVQQIQGTPLKNHIISSKQIYHDFPINQFNKYSQPINLKDLRYQQFFNKLIRKSSL